jgi:hypothetical protein
MRPPSDPDVGMERRAVARVHRGAAEDEHL